MFMLAEYFGLLGGRVSDLQDGTPKIATFPKISGLTMVYGRY